ncbi:MAG: hypothetical protein HOO06_12765 [Bdellovibrionaceae bacterium]|nr:hypothetical protein [Pseudobdellovibrionaceae bacterium]
MQKFILLIGLLITGPTVWAQGSCIGIFSGSSGLKADKITSEADKTDVEGQINKIKVERKKKKAIEYKKSMQRHKAEVKNNLLGQGGPLKLIQIHRLEEVLSSLTFNQRLHLFKEISDLNFSEIMSELKKENPDPRIEKLIQKYPGLDVVLFDLFALGKSLNGIFAVQDAVTVIPRLLVQFKKAHVNNAYKKSGRGSISAMMFSLKDNMFSTINATIESARLEYQGIVFNRGYWQKLGEWVSRVYDPLYNRLLELTQFANLQHKQIETIEAVDSIVTEVGLGKAVELNLKEGEIQALVDLILDSPKAAEQIVDIFKDLMGSEFGVTDAVYIHNLNIHKISKKLKRYSVSKIIYQFDDASIASLDSMDVVINGARVRNGLTVRTAKDFLVKTLKIYFKGFKGRLNRYKDSYLGVTSQTSNEHYTVERRYTTTRTVPDGTDANGNPKTKTITETHYRDETVRPSFERILSGNYDTGDRSVTGLRAVKIRAEDMVSIERPFRHRISSHREMVETIFDNYTKISLGTGKSQVITKLDKAIETIGKDMQSISDYIASGNSHYKKDNFENYEKRNKEMLRRHNNMKRLIEMLRELIERGEPSLFRIFDAWDFSGRLAPLKRIRNINYGVKTAIGVSALVAGTTYGVHEPFQQAVNIWASDMWIAISELSKIKP